jgi:hypothetical protein
MLRSGFVLMAIVASMGVAAAAPGARGPATPVSCVTVGPELWCVAPAADLAVPHKAKRKSRLGGQCGCYGELQWCDGYCFLNLCYGYCRPGG